MFVLRHGRLLWLLALLLGVPATWRTVSLYAHLKSDLEELLPRDAPSVGALDEMRRRNSGLQYLGVMVDTGTAAQLGAGEKLIDDLAARIRAYPPELVRDVRVGTAEERKFLEKNAPLYVDLADLKEIRRRVEARRDYEVARATGIALDDDEPPPSIDMSDLEKKYEERAGGRGKGRDRLSSADDHLTMLAVELGGFSSGAKEGRRLLERVKADVVALGGTDHYAPGMRIGYASDVAISVEEMDALESDLSVSSVLVVLAVMGAIVTYYRWWKSIPALIPPLLLAAVYAFALASLPPFRVVALNSNTAFLGSIIIGNGINFGLILLARYREERRRGAEVEEALVHGVWGARAGTLAAALAASAAYGSLAITEFRGFRQFGYIGGLGMLTSWVTAFVLIPPLVAWLDRAPARVAPPLAHSIGLMRHVVRLVERAPAVVVVVAALATAGAAWEASRFDSSRLEYDFSKLRRYDTWTKGEGYWGRRMDRLLGHYLTPTILMFDTQDDASAAEKRVRASFEGGPLRTYIASVSSADDVLPRDQEAKLAEVAAIRKALTPRIRKAIPEDKRARIDEVLGGRDLHPLTIDDLPSSFLTGLRERDGVVGRQVLVYPKPSSGLWRAEPLAELVGTLRALATEPGRPAGRVAGSIPLTSDITESIRRDAPIASLASLLGVVAVVVLALRRARAAAYVVGSLLVGVLWLGAGSMAFGLKLNFANFIAFPITFGIGVDYAVNVMARYLQDGERDIRGAVLSTGGAVGLCSLTTVIGYSSLLLAKTRALYYFGLIAVLGEVSCLTTAVVTLPALLLLVARRWPSASAASSEVGRSTPDGV
jgi:hypothetical protein